MYLCENEKKPTSSCSFDPLCLADYTEMCFLFTCEHHVLADYYYFVFILQYPSIVRCFIPNPNVI